MSVRAESHHAGIELALDGPKQHRADTKAAVREAVKGLGAKLIVVERVPTVAEALGGVATTTAALARIRVNLLDDQLQVVISDSTGKGLYVRSIPYSEEQGALAYEQVVQILRSTLVAMLAREATDEQPSQPPAQTKPKPVSPRPRNALSFDLGMASSAQAYAHELAPVPGFELQGGAHWGARRHHGALRLTASYQWKKFASPDLSLSARRLPIFGTLGHRFETGAWRIESRAGAGVVFLNLKPRETSSDVELRSSSPPSTFALRLAFRLERRVLSHLSIFTALRADFPVAPQRLVLEEPSGNTSLISPLRFQPSLALGLSVNN